MNTNTNPRFEFRLFGSHVRYLAERVMNQWPSMRRISDSSQPECDIYLLANPSLWKTTKFGEAGIPGEQFYNVKIRQEQLDIKYLSRCQQGLERWRPFMQLTFPLTAAFLQEFFFAWLAVDPPALERSFYSKRQFLQEVIKDDPALCAVSVTKQRQHYPIGNCQLEIATLCVSESLTIDTVAVESTDAIALLQLLHQLDLHSWPNTSYLTWLTHYLQRQNTAIAASEHSYTELFRPANANVSVLSG